MVLKTVLMELAQTNDFGDCLFSGIRRTIDFGDHSLELYNKYFEAFDFGLVIRVVQTIDFGCCL